MASVYSKNRRTGIAVPIISERNNSYERKKNACRSAKKTKTQLQDERANAAVRRCTNRLPKKYGYKYTHFLLYRMNNSSSTLFRRLLEWKDEWEQEKQKEHKK